MPWELIGVVVLALVGVVCFGHLRCRSKRRQFCEQRVSLPDVEFARNLEIEPGQQTAYAIAVRNAIAEMCKVPAEMIRPEDDMRQLCGLIFDGWDQVGFVLHLEDAFGGSLSEWDVPHPDIGVKLRTGEHFNEPFGKWVQRVVTYLEQAHSPGERNGSPMTICDEIIGARDCGWLRCGIVDEELGSVFDVARRFELHDDASIYHKIDLTAAKTLVKLILECDLAYGGRIMSEAKADRLANGFLGIFRDSAPSYYTNGNWHEGRQRLADGAIICNPATDATFDTGVLVVGDGRSGCLWVEDED